MIVSIINLLFWESTQRWIGSLALAVVDGMNIESLAAFAGNRLGMLFSGKVFSGLSDATQYIGTALSVFLLFLIVVLIACRWDRRSASFVFLSLSILLLYLFIPFQVQVRWVPERTTIYLFLSLLLAISVLASSESYRYRFDPGLLIIFPAIMLIAYSTYHHSNNHLKVNEYLAEYMSGLDRVEKNSTILAIRVASPMPDKVGSHLLHKLLQGGSYYAVLRDSVDVKLFQANTKVVPVVYRKSKNPYRHWIRDTEIIDLVPQVDFGTFASISEKPLDYVLIWGNLQEAMRYEKLKAPLNRLISDLEKDFDLISVSSPLGFMHLFRNRTKLDLTAVPDSSFRGAAE